MFFTKKRRSPPPMTNVRMTVILVTVGGCFLVLVPSIFFPITKTGFKRLFGMNFGDDFEGNFENFIPKKVEMAIKNSPQRDTHQVKKLPGRPQFYSGPNMEKMYTKFDPSPTQSQIEQNIGISTIVITFIVAYVLMKVLLYSNQEDNENYEDVSSILKKSPTNNTLSSDNDDKCKCKKIFMKKNIFYRKEACRRDLIQSRPSYRAFDCAGGEMNETFSSLLYNMETFRDHLYKAQICKLKLEKYKNAQQDSQQKITESEKQHNDEKHKERLVKIDENDEMFENVENISEGVQRNIENEHEEEKEKEEESQNEQQYEELINEHHENDINHSQQLPNDQTKINQTSIGHRIDVLKENSLKYSLNGKQIPKINKNKQKQAFFIIKQTFKLKKNHKKSSKIPKLENKEN